LIEVLIAVAIFSGVILSLAGLAFQIARRSTRATDQALVMGQLVSMVDQTSMVPFDSLPALTGCDTTASGAVSVVGCFNVTTISPRLKDVRIIVQTSVPGGRPDTITIRRSRPRAPIPFR